MADGRWDLVSYDTAHGRVLVARGDAVTVIDLKNGSARNIGSIAGGHAALAVPGTTLIAVTSGQDNSLRLLDADTGQEAARIAVGDKPDAAIWDDKSRRVLVMNADSGTVSVVDPAAQRVTQTIAVKPALELPALVEPDLLAVNNEDANELEWIDLKKGRVLTPLPLTGCQGPTGLAYDGADHLSLSACANGVAALVNVKTRKVVKLLPIGAGPDTALFDPKRHRFLVPCGRSGTLSVFDVGKGGLVTSRGELRTEVSARTAAIDEATGRIFLPSAQFRPAQSGQRPQAVAGAAHLLVFAPT
jgi:YVTN family beta-propeller protein